MKEAAPARSPPPPPSKAMLLQQPYFLKIRSIFISSGKMRLPGIQVVHRDPGCDAKASKFESA